jgi:hypothetical protein
VLLQSGESYQLCNSGTGRLILLGAGNSQPTQAAHTRAADSEPHTDETTGCRLNGNVPKSRFKRSRLEEKALFP